MSRTFRLITATNTETRDIVEFAVTDITDEELRKDESRLNAMTNVERLNARGNEIVRPRVATFPISQLYDVDTQRKRATMLRDYLNRLQETLDRAEKDAAFIDILSATP